MDPQTPSHLSALTPNFPTSWDSTMLGTLKECPRKFYFTHILGFNSRITSVHLRFGQLYHSGLEHYDHARAAGLSHDAAIRRMVLWALQATWTLDPTGDTEGLPWTTNDPIKNRHSLVRSLVWTAEEEANRPWSTVILANGKPAVELSFRFAAFEAGGEQIYLSGHLDKLIEYDRRRFTADRKTTKGALTATYFQQFNPSNQMTLYTIAGEVVDHHKIEGVLIAGAQIGVNFTRYAVRPTLRTKPVLTEWLQDAQWWVQQAYTFAVASHWPANDKSCGNWGGCPFMRVCAVAPSFRLAHLRADFVTFHWNPLEVRGDI
jgi:hypothetical protein